MTRRGAGDPAPADFFVLRSPLLPFDELAAWSDGLRAPAALAADDAQLEAALAADRACLRARLAAIVERPVVRDALFVATPDLDESLERWRRDPDGERGRRVERALIRYLERMAARATPFGLFAGCAVGAIGAATSLRLPPRSAYRRHTRLDMHYLCGLVAALEGDPAVRRALRFRPTSSLYRLGDRWHWVQLTPDDPAHSHRGRRLDADPALDALLSRAECGATLAELRAAADLDLDALVEQQLLVSDLQPAVTGREPIDRLIARLEDLTPAAPLAAEAAEVLRETRDELNAVDAAGVGVETERYRTLAARLETLPGPIDRAKLLQVELIKPPADGSALKGLCLGPEVLAELERGVELLRRLYRPQRDSLTRFRDAFVARYADLEPRLEVPLVEALDPEVGLGFGPSTGHDGGNPLVEGLERAAESDERSVRWGDRHALLLERLSEALAAGAREIVLDGVDLDRLATKESLPLPDAFSATAVVAATSAAALARGDFRVLLQGVAGPSGARLLGRFCHADPVLCERVHDHLRAEEALRPGAVFAEIAHWPEPRAGNILHRPLLRDHEITYLAATGALVERQIPITDLSVSVVAERVVLRSARLGREVIPRLTSAQNYFHPRTTPIYRFLAALQDQAVATKLGWDWGPLANAPFVPRVSTGRLVLARAHWRMNGEEIRTLGRPCGAEMFRALHAWRRRRGVPRYIRLVDDDNELLVDFDNILSVESFVQLIKGRAVAVLAEAFPGPDELCATGPEGRFFHELSIPFVGVGEEGLAPDARAIKSVGSDAVGWELSVPQHTTAVRRTFPPGSEWLYAKLYAAPSMVDRLLREVVRPLVDRALAAGAADGWFFVRYGDPSWHLRLRFHGEPARLHGEVLPLLQGALAPLVPEGRMRRVQIDTYEREIERYGGPEGMLLSERVFAADSVAALEIVEAFDDEALAEARWRLVLPGMDLLLEGLGLDAEGKLAVLRTMCESSVREHRADRTLLRQIGDRYRVERAGLEVLLDPARAVDGPLAPGVMALRRRSTRLMPVMAELRRAAEGRRLTLPLAELAPSYLHMHANRLLRSDQRAHELVLYDFLGRLYDSQIARARGGS